MLTVLVKLYSVTSPLDESRLTKAGGAPARIKEAIPAGFESGVWIVAEADAGNASDVGRILSGALPKELAPS